MRLLTIHNTRHRGFLSEKCNYGSRSVPIESSPFPPLGSNRPHNRLEKLGCRLLKLGLFPRLVVILLVRNEYLLQPKFLCFSFYKNRNYTNDKKDKQHQKENFPKRIRPSSTQHSGLSVHIKLIFFSFVSLRTNVYGKPHMLRGLF